MKKSKLFTFSPVACLVYATFILVIALSVLQYGDLIEANENENKDEKPSEPVGLNKLPGARKEERNISRGTENERMRMLVAKTGQKRQDMIHL
jgi:hypothetical protein